MLKIQYRFNEKINEFPSKMLYDDELKPSREGGISTRKLGVLLKKQGDEGEGVRVGEGDLEDLNEPIVFFDSEFSFFPVLFPKKPLEFVDTD